MDEYHAILAWVKQVAGLSTDVTNFSSLSNCRVLCHIFAKMAPDYIDTSAMCEDDGRDWSAYVTNCQLLIEGINRYTEAEVESSAKLDITAESVCKERNEDAIRRICNFLIAGCVSSEENDFFINAMQQLDENSQSALMELINRMNEYFEQPGDESEQPSEIIPQLSFHTEETDRLQATLKMERDRVNKLEEYYSQESNKLKQTIHQLEEEKNDALSRVEQAEGQLNINKKILKSIETDNEELNAEIATFKSKLTTCESTLNNKEELIQEISRDLEEEKKKTQLIERYKDKICELESQLRQIQPLKDENSDMSEENERLKTDNSILKEQINNQIKENTQLSSELSKSQIKITSLEKELNDLKAAYREMDKKFQEYQYSHDSSSGNYNPTTNPADSTYIDDLTNDEAKPLDFDGGNIDNNNNKTIESSNSEEMKQLKNELFKVRSECNSLKEQMEIMKQSNNEILMEKDKELEELKHNNVSSDSGVTSEELQQLNDEISHLKQDISSQREENELKSNENAKLQDGLIKMNSELKDLQEKHTALQQKCKQLIHQYKMTNEQLNSSSQFTSIALRAAFEVGQFCIQQQMENTANKSSSLTAKPKNSKAPIPVQWMAQKRKLSAKAF